MLGLADLNQSAWESMFSNSYPSTVNVRPTHPLNTDISTSDTIQLMYQHSANDLSHPVIQEAIEEIRNGLVDENDEEEIVNSVFDYVKDKVQFVEDESILNDLFGIQSGVELLITPARLLSMNRPMGDCDDFSQLTHTLLTGLGVRDNFVTVAADKDNPKKWSHVYSIAKLQDGREIPIDTSHGKYLGWEAPNITRKDIWVHHNDKGRDKDMYLKNNGMGDYYDSEGNLITEPTDTSVTMLPGSVFPPTVSPSESGGSSGFNWGSIFAPLTNVGAAIAKAQFGQPQLAPGTFIRGANGSILTNQPITGGGINLGSGGGLGSGLGGSGMLILVVVGLGLFMLEGKH